MPDLSKKKRLLKKKPLWRNIVGKSPVAYKDFWGEIKTFQNVDKKCGKKSPQNIGISQTRSCNNSLEWCQKWWMLSRHEISAFFFKKNQNAWFYFSKWFTFKWQSAFWVLNKCVLRIWLGKNAWPSVYRPSKFWHKIQDSERCVDFLLNRSRVVLGKSFL